VRDSLSAIHSNVTQAMQAQEKEEQAILKVVEGARSLAELRPSALNGGTGVGMGGQMALSQIADRLAGLARQEVERCFNQTFMPLQNALSGVVDRSRRAYRWLFNALHSWDVPVLRSRPLWDGWMIIASVLGIGLGVTSLVVGGKRLARSWPWRRIR
jgi:hypothetical protein